MQFPLVQSNQAFQVNQTLASSYTVSLVPALKVERVTATVTLTYSNRGALIIMLTSPANVTSVLAYPRHLDTSTAGLSSFTFTSVKHWGEAANGTWTLSIASTQSLNNTGSLTCWSLSLYGEGNVTSVSTTSSDVQTGVFTTTEGIIIVALIVALVLGLCAYFTCRRPCGWVKSEPKHAHNQHSRVLLRNDQSAYL